MFAMEVDILAQYLTTLLDALKGVYPIFMIKMSMKMIIATCSLEANSSSPLPSGSIPW